MPGQTGNLTQLLSGQESLIIFLPKKGINNDKLYFLTKELKMRILKKNNYWVRI